MAVIVSRLSREAVGELPPRRVLETARRPRRRGARGAAAGGAAAAGGGSGGAGGGDGGEGFFSNPFRNYFDEESTPKGEASGSGVIISADGYIATNNHVIEEASEVLVTLFDNRVYAGRIVGVDYNTDLALIKIDDEGLPHLPFGDSDGLQVGEWVLALGNPMDLTSTVTAGIVSAKGRNINLLAGERNTDAGLTIESFIQTDAAVNRGNSGGALVNTGGQLVGINTAIAFNVGIIAHSSQQSVGNSWRAARAFGDFMRAVMVHLNT